MGIRQTMDRYDCFWRLDLKIYNQVCFGVGKVWQCASLAIHADNSRLKWEKMLRLQFQKRPLYACIHANPEYVLFVMCV